MERKEGFELVDSDDTSSDSNSTENFIDDKSDFEKKKPRYSEDFLNRFKALAKRTDEVTGKTTQSRIKNLQRDVMDKVNTEIHLPEDRDVLHEHDVKFGPPVNRPKDENRKRKREIDNKTGEKNECKSEWLEVKPFLTANDHLKGTDPGKYGPKTKLEEKIDKAISDGNFDMAESLSDRLSTRDFGKKIADAIDAKAFSEDKQAEKESIKAKKKKKLPWGFQQKQRWETKSNM